MRSTPFRNRLRKKGECRGAKPFCWSFGGRMGVAPRFRFLSWGAGWGWRRLVLQHPGKAAGSSAPLFLVACGLTVALLSGACGGGRNSLILGATTTVQDPGLLDVIVKAFEEKTGYDVTVAVGGSGQILEQARRGELDVIMTHSPVDEQKFMADGEGLDPRKVMENYFLVAGPPADPAGVEGAPSLEEAFRRIAAARAPFISRGDGSGTHKRELATWSDLGLDPKGQSWYTESAVGQGQNVLVAAEKRAYTLADSGTFISFRERTGLAGFVTDYEHPNVYTVTIVDPAKHPSVNVEGAREFAAFVTGADAQQLIDDFGREKYGESLYVPIAAEPPSPGPATP